MDDRRFDHLARALGGASTRRSALGALLGLGLAGAAGHDAGAKKKRRKKCDPACGAGQTCVKGACRCDNGGTVCGANCCLVGQRCESGSCMAEPAQCIAAGEPCKGVGRRCCDGRACASGQGGKTDVACYVPAGGACATTADCVWFAECVRGVCEDRQPTPTPRCAPTFPVTADAAVNGKALQDAVVAASSGDTIVLAPGDYRFDSAMSVDNFTGCLTISGKSIAIERCSADALVNLVCPATTDATGVHLHPSAQIATELTLKGVTVTSERTTGLTYGVRNRNSTLTLEDVSITMAAQAGVAVYNWAVFGLTASTVIKRGVTLANGAQGVLLSALRSEANGALSNATISCEAAPAIDPNYPTTNATNLRCRANSVNGGTSSITTDACGCPG